VEREYGLMPLKAVRAVEEADIVILQSGRTGAAGDIMAAAKEAVTLDSLYEEAEDFDSLYESGADLIAGLSRGRDAVLCVTGDVYTNGFVRRLLENGGVELLATANTVGYSLFLSEKYIGGQECYSAVDARSIANANINTSGAVVVTGIDSVFTAYEAKRVLAEHYGPDTKAVAVNGADASYGMLYISKVDDLGNVLDVVISLKA
jgi:tetrapyrrole methylase family protein/MazG family protein